MPINKEVVAWLQHGLQEKAWNYEQTTFGRSMCTPDDFDIFSQTWLCKTEFCIAGALYIKARGEMAFMALIAGDGFDTADAKVSGDLLGIEWMYWDVSLPRIFDAVIAWPKDLRCLYIQNRHQAAIQALDRLQEDGSIAEVEG